MTEKKPWYQRLWMLVGLGAFPAFISLLDVADGLASLAERVDIRRGITLGLVGVFVLVLAHLLIRWIKPHWLFEGGDSALRVRSCRSVLISLGVAWVAACIAPVLFARILPRLTEPTDSRSGRLRPEAISSSTPPVAISTPVPAPARLPAKEPTVPPRRQPFAAVVATEADPNVFEGETLSAGLSLPLVREVLQRWPESNEKVTEVTTKGDRRGFLRATGRKGIREQVAVFRSREDANLIPSIFVVERAETKEAQVTVEAEYRQMCAGYEPALVLRRLEGSGAFLSIIVIMWDDVRKDHVDLMAGIEESFPHAAFTFADLDQDGCNELVVTHGWKAIGRRTQYFRLDDGLLVEVQQGSRRYLRFRDTLLEVRDQEPLELLNSDSLK